MVELHKASSVQEIILTSVLKCITKRILVNYSKIVIVRADPFLTCRAEAALTRNVTTNEPASGRNKSGLTRTAQDAARVEIMWPHHRVWRGISPVTYGNLNPLEFVFGYLAIVREMEQSEYVLSTMLRTLYNFALACTKHLA